MSIDRDRAFSYLSAYMRASAGEAGGVGHCADVLVAIPTGELRNVFIELASFAASLVVTAAKQFNADPVEFFEEMRRADLGG